MATSAKNKKRKLFSQSRKKVSVRRPWWHWVGLYAAIGIILFAAVTIAYMAATNIASLKNLPTVYKGVIPCADCPGIEASISFSSNHTYNQTNVYMERDVIATDSGTWAFAQGTPKNPNAQLYELTDSQTHNTAFYRINGNQIIPLDADKNEIPAPYNAPLTKQ